MRDYSELHKKEINWKSNDEIIDFEKRFKRIIMSVFQEAKIKRYDSDMLYNDILIKFASNKFNYDKKIGKMETFLYQIALNAAHDYWRENNRNFNRNEEITEKHIAPLQDTSNNTLIEFEHKRMIVVETLKRLFNQRNMNKTKMEIFTRRFFTKHSISDLAEEYKQKECEISLSVSRCKKQYLKLYDIVEEEMNDNCMTVSDTDINFVQRYLDFSLEIKGFAENTPQSKEKFTIAV